MESIIPLKLVLGGVRIVALPIVLMNRLNKMQSAVFLYCRFSTSEGSIFSRLLKTLFLYSFEWLL